LAKSASAEIQQVIVSQGDSVLIINRDLAAVKRCIEQGPAAREDGVT
jgi:hypothetical protein